MTSRQPPGDLGHVLPFVKLTRLKLAALAENDEAQARKLGEHDRAFAAFHQDLETLKNLHQAQIDHIDAMLRRAGMNGR